MAKVSKSTVSRYLNGGYVSTAASAKIEMAIKETKFEPNTFAQSLKLKQTNFVGVIIPRLDSYTMTKTLMGIDEKLKELGFQMLVANTDRIPEREIENVFAFSRQKVAGVLLMAAQLSEKHTDAFRDTGMPAVVIGQESKELHCLVHADYEAGYGLGSFIYQKGHRNILYIGVSEKDEAVGKMRREGFAKALEDGGSHELKFAEGDFSMQQAKKLTEKTLEGEIPDAIICATDNMALGAMKAIQEKGLSIPGDVSVAGFGGYRISEMVHPGLTTVSFHYYKAGQQAASSLVSLIEGNPVEEKMVSGFEIIERESVSDKS
ncbi:substrate-binding domain-containing protein [Bacillus mangrovi]|uniref:Substrate-binding domain-containing protein n=2 Tax=Metabacillus mangrovi TaxID=1491830 RepID=A0A7X2V3D2_9BACI|nr:substrate-binding domain-containing protein [Metabacillus mangrovi]